jgi:hypothetical protein
MAPDEQSNLMQNGEPPQDEKSELLQRVASSPAFRKSNRLREFLLFIGERTLKDPESAIHEQELWVEVFHRPSGSSANEDTLVRVHASQLRKKLQQYFSGEGKDEAIIIDLPKGGYTPVFRPRDPAPAPFETSSTDKRAGTIGTTALLAIAGALVLVCVFLAWQNFRLRQRAEFAVGARPQVDALWRQLFGNGQQTHLVLADGNLVAFENEINEQISLRDYETGQFERLAEQRIADPATRNLTLSVLGRRYTGTADAKIAFNMALLFGSNELPVDIIFARNLTTAQVSSHNTILLGSTRSNPWVGLFEDKMNFPTVFEEQKTGSPREVHFANLSPRPGERLSFPVVWGRTGYCRVAYFPNLKGTGNVLIISGSEVQMTEAGGEFITSERWVEQLRNSLGLSPTAPVPPFEALLEGEIITGSVANFHLVACRRH